jgi:hypothetical protein
MSGLIALVGQMLRRLGGPLIVGLSVLLTVLLVGGLAWNGWRDAGAQARAREAARQQAMAGQGQRDMDRQVREQETRDDILSAPDAGASAGAAGDAGLAGLCRRAVYRDHPRCAGLRGPDPAPAAR